ncbi:hypothetical protein GSI_08771 [Ganoderma sinense ZZ0214-1]|uniref:Uncharacterized protein n=1 Tax=Ganoderma sinense ZZ0214-1 TaxID=1077348 RepID=A0A2G8S4S4_9APHY|nr:hypothetical protein GSI_08771 [Ganoderma sinense ZZ0214-1]
MTRSRGSWSPTLTIAFYFLYNNLNLGEAKKSSGKCIGSLACLDISLGSYDWFLSDSFMNYVCTAFSFDNNSVGLAKLFSRPLDGCLCPFNKQITLSSQKSQPRRP